MNGSALSRTALLVLLLALIPVVSGCGRAGKKEEIMVKEYVHITQEEARRMMTEEDVVIVDVRRQDEYDEGHIPGAVCIPNESIGDEMPEELPDTDQVILVYCRSGRRSREAAQKLADMGYTGVYEFGGILDWTGEVVKD